MDHGEDLTPQDVADNIRAMRRAEEITQERFGEFAAQPGWSVVTVWQSEDAAPYGVAFYNGLAGEVIGFVRDVELHLEH